MRFEILNDGVRLTFERNLGDWADSVASSHVPLAARLLADCENMAIPTSLSTFILPNETVAAWPEAIALLAGFPKNVPFPLDLKLSRGLGQSGARLSLRWLKVASTLPLSQSPKINGLLLEASSHKFRLTYPIFKTIELAEKFNAASESNPDEQFRIWSDIRKTLGEDAVANLTESFLRSFRVVTADAFSFSFSTDVRGDLQIIPVLMTDGDSEPDETRPRKTRALLEAEEEKFAARLDALPEDASAFPLEDGTYIIVDQRLQKALSVVRQLRKAPVEERKRAALHPEAVLQEVLGESFIDDSSNQPLFVETEKYSDRVFDVAEWVPPAVPWIKVEGQAWIPPNDFGLRIGEAEISLKGPELGKAIEKVERAIANQEPIVELQGQKVSANQHTLDMLKNLNKEVTARQKTTPSEKPNDNVLVIQTNFEGNDFGSTFLPPRPGNPNLPDRLRTQPKEHQIDGITWLQQHWINGSTGAILADDMGLGKTFQALAFAAWLQELMAGHHIEKKPILIVAPVGLLKNWEAEIQQHLSLPGLGDVIHAYGDRIKYLKRGSHSKGTISLDNIRLSSADLILTNYEAVSDYQLSFGAIHFASVIFDEAQKIKSPKARMTHAAKALNADFILAMTGTPIENRLADLWCIADTVQPLALGQLKTFSATYESESAADELIHLRSKIWQEESSIHKVPPLMMLRRLKGEKLAGLPEKHEHFPRREMPKIQIEAYEEIISKHFVSGPKGTLGTIQALRSVSLHPRFLRKEDAFDPMSSARFQLALEILDNCHKANEKTLIFLESLELQGADELPLLLKKRYGLSNFPMVINGTVDTATRQDRVDTFQRASGFDVMILSPKAGGVGLTLTAANHVIHLSRWWNPAVEDQCSDRVYRIGQLKPVHIYYPMAIYPSDPDHSFDVKLDLLMRRKRELSRQLLAPPVITHEDYEELLQSVKIH